MAPPSITIPPSTSQECTNTWPNRIRTRWKSQNMQGMAPKILFMTGFLINSTAMSGLFFLLNFQFDQAKNSSQICVPSPVIYKYSISISCTFFTFLALIVFVVMCLMQCKRYKLENNAYKFITIFGATAFLYSTLLVLISSTAIIMQTECKESRDISELKLRHFIQSMAACITNLIYMIVGVSLLKNQAVVIPVPPRTPIYQISPPEFDTLFPPPPTYQQSQMHQQIQ